MGVLELHLWCCRADRVEQPDRLVFDLDPDEDIPFKRVIEAARDMRKRLAKLRLKSFPLVTGGKGIHVVVPLQRGHSWDEHRDFAEAMARVMAEEEPDRYTATLSKAKRRGKIFIDYLRNQRGASAIAPYSSRARKGASIAVPVAWPALARLRNAQPARVGEFSPRGDPWKGYFALRQRLPRGTRA
jgi:bifunctional non-homologous end joining protein LigD